MIKRNVLGRVPQRKQAWPRSGGPAEAMSKGRKYFRVRYLSAAARFTTKKRHRVQTCSRDSSPCPPHRHEQQFLACARPLLCTGVRCVYFLSAVLRSCVETVINSLAASKGREGGGSHETKVGGGSASSLRLDHLCILSLPKFGLPSSKLRNRSVFSHD